MKQTRNFHITDLLLLIGAALPVLAAILLKVLLIPASDGIEITGAHIFFTIPLPFFDLPVTEAQVNSWCVILSLLCLCLWFTHGIRAGVELKRQTIAEWIVEKCDGLVGENMGSYFTGFGPFVASILALSAFSSLMSLFGLFPPTSDLNVVAGWAILVFVLITYYKMKCGPIHYLKSFADPPALAPLNVISEVATPISMAFRHYGNILSGTVISVLVAAGLQGLTKTVLGWLPGVLGEIPFLRIGLPAILSIYFDVFSGCLQAFIFAMLTMLYISGAFAEDDYYARQEKKHKQVKHTVS